MAIIKSITIGDFTLDIDDTAISIIPDIEALLPSLQDNIEFSRLLQNNKDTDGRVTVTMDGGPSRVVIDSLETRADKTKLNLNPDNWGTGTSYIGYDGDRHEMSFQRVFTHELVHVLADCKSSAPNGQIDLVA